MSTYLERLTGNPSPEGVWGCPEELYARRTMIDLFICRQKGDYNDELERRFDIKCVGLSNEHQSMECDSFVYGNRRYRLVRHSATGLMVPEGQRILQQPEPNAYVIYYVTADAPMEVDNAYALFSSSSGQRKLEPALTRYRPTHFGVVTDLNDHQVKIRSKWGEADVYLHDLWDVITPYGNVAIFVSPP